MQEAQNFCSRAAAAGICSKHGTLAEAQEDISVNMVCLLHAARVCMLADVSHAARHIYVCIILSNLPTTRGSVSENIDRKKAEVFEDIGVEAEDDEDWTQLSDHMPSKKRRL